mmetsp:Transcript_36137/g.95975  ORF Transcript_36137/g.95975 Transcript_36137/m.95975 type:complete len:97 (+) Transcript_36137:2025-2315(+)
MAAEGVVGALPSGSVRGTAVSSQTVEHVTALARDCPGATPRNCLEGCSQLEHFGDNEAIRRGEFWHPNASEQQATTRLPSVGACGDTANDTCARRT